MCIHFCSWFTDRLALLFHHFNNSHYALVVIRLVVDVVVVAVVNRHARLLDEKLRTFGCQNYDWNLCQLGQTLEDAKNWACAADASSEQRTANSDADADSDCSSDISLIFVILSSPSSSLPLRDDRRWRPFELSCVWLSVSVWFRFRSARPTGARLSRSCSCSWSWSCGWFLSLSLFESTLNWFAFGCCRSLLKRRGWVCFYWIWVRFRRRSHWCSVLATWVTCVYLRLAARHFMPLLGIVANFLMVTFMFKLWCHLSIMCWLLPLLLLCGCVLSGSLRHCLCLVYDARSVPV